MELTPFDTGLYRTMPTPEQGWQGSVTGLYLHPDGIAWYKAPIPFIIHRCRPWSIGITGSAFNRHLIQRCACGSHQTSLLIRGWDPGQDLIWDKEMQTPWHERNSRMLRRHGFVTLM